MCMFAEHNRETYVRLNVIQICWESLLGQFLEKEKNNLFGHQQIIEFPYSLYQSFNLQHNVSFFLG